VQPLVERANLSGPHPEWHVHLLGVSGLQLLEELNRPGVETLPYPLQRALVRNLSIVAERASKPDLLPLWAGQSVGLSRQSNAKTLLQTLVDEVSAIADPVLRWSHERQELTNSKRNRWNSTGSVGV
jgi:hypothetical protein